MKIVYTDESEKSQIVSAEEAKGSVLIEEQNHIIGFDESGNEIREKALVFGDGTETVPLSLVERVLKLEEDVALLKGI